MHCESFHLKFEWEMAKCNLGKSQLGNSGLGDVSGLI